MDPKIYKYYLEACVSHDERPGIKRLTHVSKEVKKNKFYMRGNATARNKYMRAKKIQFAKMNSEYYKSNQKIMYPLLELFKNVIKNEVFDVRVCNLRFEDFFKLQKLQLYREFNSWINRIPHQDAEDADMDELAAANESPNEEAAEANANNLAPIAALPPQELLFTEFRQFLKCVFYEWLLFEIDTLLLAIADNDDPAVKENNN